MRPRGRLADDRQRGWHGPESRADAGPLVTADDRVLVTGAGGFIGGHLVAELLRRGHRRIRAVDIKPIDRVVSSASMTSRTVQLDLRRLEACREAAAGATAVFNLAADMGGMGFIETHKADCMLSVLINTHMLMAARDAGVERFFYASSACVYRADKQNVADVRRSARSRRLSGDAGGRLRLGEAVQRAHVPPLHRGLRAGDASGALPQRLRAARHLRRRAARRRRRRSAAR